MDAGQTRGMLCLVALLTPLASQPSTSEAVRPNIVLIVADDLGYADLSCYGAEDLRSPHLDRLAARGQRWTNFYANCPVCSPTRAALLTGRYQDLVGVPGVIRTHRENNWGDLVDEAVTLPQVLREAGYATHCIGKWHLGLDAPDRPHDRGFDRFVGFLGDMMDDYYTHRRHDINYMRRGDETIDPEGHATDLFTQWAVDTLEEGLPKAEPLFLYLAYNAPHTPIQPPSDWLTKVRQREPGISEKRAKLVALIEHMDDGIGRVLDAVDASDEPTVVIFTSDNGGQLSVGASNGPHRDGKGSVYEGGLAVPTIIDAPGLTAAGTETDQLALSMDLTPTIAELAGTRLPDPVDGVSLVPTLQGEGQGELRSTHFFRRREGGRAYNGMTINAVRSGPWKLVQNSPFAPFELYNLANDPLEETDLIDKAPKVRKALVAAMSEHRQRCGAVRWQAAATATRDVSARLPTSPSAAKRPNGSRDASR